MKIKGNLWATLIVVMSLFGLAGCGGDAAPSATATTAATSTPADTWQSFTSEDGRFTVSMPGEPTESNQSAESQVGTLNNYFFKYEDGSDQYLVSYVDYPEDTMEGSDREEVVADSFETTFEKTPDTINVIDKDTITVDGHPGMTGEIEYTSGSGNYVWYKQVLVNNRMYQVLATTPTSNKEAFAEDAIKFQDSFELVDPPAADEEATPTQGAGGGTIEGWQTVTSEEGQFTVSMPGEPQETSSTTDTAVGPITQQMFQYSEDGPEFLVAYADYPEQTSDADAVKLLGDTIVGASQGNTIQNQAESTQQGFPSVSGEWEVAGTNYTWYKAILVEDRLYQLAVATSLAGKDTFEPQARQFLKSFQLNR